MKRSLTLKLLLGFALSSLAHVSVGFGTTVSWYTDVPDHYAYNEGIHFLTDAGHVAGYEDGTFKPEKEVSRAEALRMILNEAEVDTLDSSESEIHFSDVNSAAWYLNDLKTAISLGFISGYSDNTFKPEGTLNQAEALKILLLANNISLLKSDDTNWFAPYLDYAKAHALIFPNEDGAFTPEKILTRGELADLIYRLKKEPYLPQVEHGIASYYGRSFDGRNTASGTALDAESFMAAHKTLPFGTVVRITNLDTLMSVEVTIVDRGPYTEGYIIDLTPTAFEQIGALSTGILKVRLEVLK